MITREIIDVHTHIWPDRISTRAADNIVGYYGIPRQGDGSVGEILEGAKEFSNIRFVISSATLKPELASVGNDYLIDCSLEDSRFIPLASFHPLMGFDNAVAEFERAKCRGAKGIKIHSDFQKFYIDDPNAMEIYKEAARLKLPILFHVGDKTTDFSTPRRTRNVLEKLPELTIIAAHMCGYSVWDEAKEYLIGTPVYTDTSEARLGMDANSLYELIHAHGVDRVMFGSDYPLWRTDYSYSLLEECGMTDAEKTKIYSENAKSVFGIE